MEAYVIVQRKKQTVLTSITDDTLVSELKNNLSYVLKVAPQNQKLFYKGEDLENSKKVSDYGVSTLHHNKPHFPAYIIVAFRTKEGDFEDLEVSPYTNPPELPFVLRNHEAEETCG